MSEITTMKAEAGNPLKNQGNKKGIIYDVDYYTVIDEYKKGGGFPQNTHSINQLVFPVILTVHLVLNDINIKQL